MKVYAPFTQLSVHKGSYYFQFEHDADRTILNELEKQYKCIDVDVIDERKCAKDLFRVKNESFVNSGAKIHSIKDRDTYRRFRTNLLIDANNTPCQYFSVCFPFPLTFYLLPLGLPLSFDNDSFSRNGRPSVMISAGIR